MKSKQTISVIIPVKNEEKIIQACLDAIKWADEIIIIDNGSTDKTVEICKQVGCKVYSHPQNILIPALQNIGMKKATKDWILILDADVIVPEAATAEIQQRIHTEDFDGYYLPHKTYIMGKFMKSSFWTFPILKLFKRGVATFPEQSAHETVLFHGKVGKIKNALLHYSHPSLELEVKKLNKYSSQDAKLMYEQKRGGQLKREIKRVSLYHLLIQPFMYFVYLFFYRGGYRDGIHGCIVDTMMAFSIFFEAAKVWEFEEREKIKSLF